MFDILSVIPGRKRSTPNGWVAFNCPVCSSLGHNPDKRSRGGIKFDGPERWSYHCFNCSFTCGFVLGESITFHTRKLLQICGVDDDQINRWSFESFRLRGVIDAAVNHKEPPKNIDFPLHTLPEAEFLDIHNEAHAPYVNYLCERGLQPEEYPYMVSPNSNEGNRNRNRIIIPFTYNNKIVGHTSRYLDNLKPKYINHMPPGYVFGLALQKPQNAIAIVVEGIFDAISIGGCAVMHDDINDEQARLLSTLNKRIIYVPDLDKTGLVTCDRALELGYSVSIPQWGAGVKDTNDAVKLYGKLPTLLSILSAETKSAAVVNIRRNKVVKGT